MSKYVHSLIKGNQTLTNKVKDLEAEAKEYKDKYYKKLVRIQVLERTIDRLESENLRLENRIKELEERDPIESILNLGKRLGL